MARMNTKSSALDGWVDIFRTGEHTSSNGVKRSFTDTDLDKIVENSQVRDDAPVVVGHPDTDSPAYAWVDQLRRSGDRLQARLQNINCEFRKAVESDRYRGRSVSLKPLAEGGFALRHIGFLGGAAPAVDGLTPTQFSIEDAAETFEFANGATESPWLWKLRSVAQVFRNFREWIIDRDGLDAADKVVPEFQINTLEDPNFSAPPEGPDAAQDDTSINSTTDTGEVTAMDSPDTREAEFAERERKIKQREQAVEATERKAAEDAVAAQLYREADERISKLVEDGKVLPAEREKLARFAAALPGDEQTIEFSDSGATKTRPIRSVFFDHLDALPKRVEYAEVSAPLPGAPGSGALDNETIAREAQNYAEKQRGMGINITIAQAVDHIRREKGAES